MTSWLLTCYCIARVALVDTDCVMVIYLSSLSVSSVAAECINATKARAAEKIKNALKINVGSFC